VVCGGGTLLDAGLAVVGWLAIGWLPGMLVLDLTRPAAGVLRNAAFASLVAVGLTMIVAEGLYALDVPIRAYTVLPLTLGIPAVLWCFGRMREGGRTSDRPRSSSSEVAIRATRADLALIAVAVLVGIAIWCLTIRSTSAVLPNTDGSHHGLFAERIRRFGTLDPRVVLSGDRATGTPRSSYYPLALHVVAALISAATGVSVSVVFTVGYVAAASVILPVGVYLLTRRLCPQPRGVAAVAALFSVAFTWFPYGPITWGGIPTIVAMCQIPIAVDAVLYRRGDGKPWVVGGVLGIAAFGIFHEHNSELVSVALYGALLAVPLARAATSTERRALWIAWGIGAGLFLLLVAPQVPQLLGGASEASSVSGNAATSNGATPTKLTPGSANHVLSLVFSPVMLVAALCGLAIAVRRKQFPGWGYCLIATVVLFLGTLGDVPVLSSLTAPWYRATIRVTYAFSFFEVTYAALAVVVLARFAASSRASSAAVRRGAIVLVAGIVAAAEVPATVGLARLGYAHSSLVGADQRAGFGWLADHVQHGQRVLNQFIDGSAWMETLSDVAPVFATKPPQSDPSKTWGDRWYLVTHACDLGSDMRAQRAVRTWNVRYVYVNDRHFDGTGPAILDARRLATCRALRQVWHRGGVSIFEVTLR
jgi:hypothetical protein